MSVRRRMRAAEAPLPAPALRELYRCMVLLRRFELAAQKVCRDGELPGFVHLYLGQEAVAAGCLALADPDSMPNNRSLLLPELCPRSWPEAAELLVRLEENPSWREALRQRQAERAEWLLVDRPLRDWITRWRSFRQEARR